MNSRSKYSTSRKTYRHGWPRGFHANQLEAFLGANGCGTSQLKTFEELHVLAKQVFDVHGAEDYKITTAQIDALGKKERRRRISSYVQFLTEPSALWPEVSRARGTLVGNETKAQAAGRQSGRPKRVKPACSKDAFRWPRALKELHAWMVALGVDFYIERTEHEILELAWEMHQSVFPDVAPGVMRPATLAAMQRRLTSGGQKYRIWERATTPSRLYRLGTFGPASPVRNIPVLPSIREKERG